jgi:hypothetical protein
MARCVNSYSVQIALSQGYTVSFRNYLWFDVDIVCQATARGFVLEY